jgi:hypothetical protein
MLPIKIQAEAIAKIATDAINASARAITSISQLVRNMDH